MYINGTNNSWKSFKVDTVDPQDGQPTNDPNVQDMNNSLDGLFGDPTSGGTPPPQDEWVIVDPTAPSPEANSLAALSNYPPTLDEILVANPNAVQYVDMIKTRYETTKEGLLTLRDNYTAALPSVSAGEAQILQQKIDLVNAAIMKCDQQIEKCSQRMDNDAKVYDQEKATGKDLNGDGWIGRPGAADSLRVVYDAKGNPYYLDKDGNRISNPVLDPEYKAKVIDSNSIDQISADLAIGTDQDEEKADLYFKVKDVQQDYGSDFDTPVNIGVPEYLWVKRDKGAWEAAEDTESDSNESKLVVDPDLWQNGVQVTPEEAGKNKSDYVQVRVAEVEVGSEKVHGITTVNGKDLYNTIVKFKDGEGRVIATIRIEGYSTNTKTPAATETTTGYYVAASTLTPRFFGSDRVSALKFNVSSSYESTGRHIVDDFAKALGIDGKDGTRAYDENKAAFEGESFKTSYWQVTSQSGGVPDSDKPDDISNSTGHWEEVDHQYSYEGYHDYYMTDEPGDKDMLDSFQTGVIVDGLRGSFTGSKFNDIFKVPDVNDLSDYAKEHQPDDAENIHTGDPLYATYIDGGAGANAVVAGKGDLFAEGINFASVDASMDDDIAIVESYDAFNSKDEGTAQDESLVSTDPKIFVRVKNAGTATLFQDQSQNRSSKWDPGFRDGYVGDDYYEGISEATHPDDADMASGTHATMAETFAGQSDAYTKTKTDLETAIVSNGTEDDTFDAKTEWENEYGKYGDASASSQEEADMDAFFNSMFGDLNELKVEMDQMSAGTP